MLRKVQLARHRTSRIRAAALLLLFALALVFGVLGHPPSNEQTSHACHSGGHIAPDTDAPQHDEATCFSCHLFQALQSSTSPAFGDLPTAQPSLRGRAPCSPFSVPPRAELLSYSSRAPPLV